MRKAKLTRLSSVHDNLRTNEIEGVAYEPVLGKCFELVGPPLDPLADVRLVYTTPVLTLKVLGHGPVYSFTTRNSHYKVEFFEKEVCA